MTKRDNLYALLAFSISFLILFYFYHEVLLHLNDYVFSDGGDGIKNYYTYLYHAKYDSSFFEFSGMNYPFKENVVFTDAHPLLSYIIGQFGLANYGIGIVNFLMLISYPISTVFIYKIFKNFKVNVLWSICAAIAITFMAPQIFRLTGHFSMSYVFAVPIMWYLLIKTTQFPGVKWNIITAVYLIIFFFTHPYLGLILTVFALSYWIVSLVINRKTKGTVKRVLINIGLQVALPILIFQILVMISDVHEGRLNNPAGFFDLHASLSSLLVAHHGPIVPIKPFFGWECGNWESWAYIGFATMVYFLVITGYVIKNRKTINYREQLKKPLFIFFVASFLVLLFAMCIPFRWDLFKWIVNLFGPLKQFRVLGRFTWIFFYVFTTMMVILLFKIREKQSNKTLINSVFFAGIIFFVLEFSPAHQVMEERITQAKNPFKIENLDSDLNDLITYSNQSKYDAIIFLPYTHMSSENVHILGSEHSIYDALMLSYHTNTPLFNTISSRTALYEAITMINLFSPDFIEKELAKIVGNNKKILLVKNSDELDFNEQRMVNVSGQTYQNSTFTAFDFSFNRWNNDIAFKSVLKKSESAKVELSDGWYSDTTTWFYYNGFNDTPDQNAMAGGGAFAQKKIGWNKLIELNSEILVDGDYILNFWYNINIGRPDVLAVAEYVTEDTTIWVDQFMVRETNLVVDNTWAYVELKFSFKSTDKVNILLTSGPSDDWMVVDELLIRKQSGGDLFNTKGLNHPFIGKDSREFIIYNNYWIDKSSFRK